MDIDLVVVSQTIRGAYKATRGTDVVSIPTAAEMQSSACVTSGGRQPKYFIQGKIGQGSFGPVYLANNTVTGGRVAIKRVRAETGHKEACVMQTLAHSNCVRLLEVHTSDDDGYVYLVMEHMGSGELYSAINDSGGFCERKAVRMMRQIAEGVKHMHEHAFIHFDLKPENILLETTPCAPDWVVAKVADFGLSMHVKDVDFGVRRGSPGYAAPEVLKPPVTGGTAVGTKVDLWSLGVIFYCVLCASLPWEEKGYMTSDAVSKGMFDFHEKHNTVSYAVRELIRELLVPDPAERLCICGMLASSVLEGGDPIGTKRTRVQSHASSGACAKKAKTYKCNGGSPIVTDIKDLSTLSEPTQQPHQLRDGRDIKKIKEQQHRERLLKSFKTQEAVKLKIHLESAELVHCQSPETNRIATQRKSKRR